MHDNNGHDPKKFEYYNVKKWLYENHIEFKKWSWKCAYAYLRINSILIIHTNQADIIKPTGTHIRIHITSPNHLYKSLNMGTLQSMITSY